MPLMNPCIKDCPVYESFSMGIIITPSYFSSVGIFDGGGRTAHPTRNVKRKRRKKVFTSSYVSSDKFFSEGLKIYSTSYFVI